MSDKRKYPREHAELVAMHILRWLEPYCERIEVAGSIRRRKDHVGDIEIVYVPKTKKRLKEAALFEDQNVYETENFADNAIASLVHLGKLRKRLNTQGHPSYGTKNKLMIAVKSGIPVDFFATTKEAWWNYLVCRTGGADTNTEIATAAQRKGWKWHPYKAGFTDAQGRLVKVRSEREVFELAGLDYREPWERR